jgi:hypothetical protein
MSGVMQAMWGGRNGKMLVQGGIAIEGRSPECSRLSALVKNVFCPISVLFLDYDRAHDGSRCFPLNFPQPCKSTEDEEAEMELTQEEKDRIIAEENVRFEAKNQLWKETKAKGGGHGPGCTCPSCGGGGGGCACGHGYGKWGGGCGCHRGGFLMGFLLGIVLTILLGLVLHRHHGRDGYGGWGHHWGYGYPPAQTEPAPQR